jgi:hypothetical protein
VIPNTPYNQGAALLDYYLGSGYRGLDYLTKWWTGLDVTQPMGAQIIALAATLPPPWNEAARAETYGFAITPGSDLEINWLGLVQERQNWDAQTIRSSQRSQGVADDLGWGESNG